MNLLNHIIEPERLLLTWQPTDENAQPRTRRVVAEIFSESNGQLVFRYLKGTSDFNEAKSAGFIGFPAFHLEREDSFRHDVLEVFLRRLPPRTREDFGDFLSRHRLPSPFNYSDITLLGYTGARLPSDGFGLVPIFPSDKIPCDYLMEIAGSRRVLKENLTDNVALGDAITFSSEESNPIDRDALVVVCRQRNIGYVNRVLLGTFHHWLKMYRVKATVERLNGTPERPFVYVRVNVS